MTAHSPEAPGSAGGDRPRRGVVYLNGQFIPEGEAGISVFDHGVLYGDGVFDTLFASFGFIFKLEEHLARFERSARAIRLDLPATKDEIREAVISTVERNGLRDAYIKVVATRGVGPEPLLDPRGCRPTLLIFARPYISLAHAGQVSAGLSVKVVTVQRVGAAALDARIKSLNYLNLVLAKVEAIDAGFDEALLMDEEHRICEAPGYNVFTVHGRELRTPMESILEGITRETVLDLAAANGLAVRPTTIRSYDLLNADEVFLTSTAAGIVPVTIVDGRPVGMGHPGPVVLSLRDAYLSLQRSGLSGTPVTMPALHP